MAKFRDKAMQWGWALATAAVLGAGPQSAEKKKPGPEAAREVVSSLRSLNAAVKAADVKKPSESMVKVPKLPPRTVTPPTLTSADVDALLNQQLSAAKVPLAAPTYDVEFVRRAHLDLTGKLPSPEQVRNFVQTKGKDKRAKLLEYLLNNPEYARNWARYWRDVIRFKATNENPGQVRYDEFEDWLTDQLEKNRPWDEIARAIIAGTGRNDEENPVAFAIAHDGQAVELAGEVSRVFLGVQIQCAQCHDHPNDSWKRQQFHEFAAFFANTRVRRVGDAKGPNRIFEVVAQGRPRYTMPDKKDPQTQIFVAPKFFLDEKGETVPQGLTAEERRNLAASYVVNQENPWFAKAFVNRVWYVLMGEGFYMPVDDIGPERTAKAPEVIDAIAGQWAQGGYDVKWLFRTIMNTEAYQREIRSTYSPSGKVPFASVAPARLRSDQILDSLGQVLNLPLGGDQGNNSPMTKKQAGALAKDLQGAAGKTKGGGMRGGGAARNQFNNLFGVDPSTPFDDVLGTIPQALFLMNGPQINNAMKAGPNTPLGQVLRNTSDNHAALKALYVRVFARDPTAKEMQVNIRYIERVGNRAEAFEDILWSLINSTEFITRR